MKVKILKWARKNLEIYWDESNQKYKVFTKGNNTFALSTNNQDTLGSIIAFFYSGWFYSIERTRKVIERDKIKTNRKFKLNNKRIRP